MRVIGLMESDRARVVTPVNHPETNMMENTTMIRRREVESISGAMGTGMMEHGVEASDMVRESMYGKKKTKSRTHDLTFISSPLFSVQKHITV